MHWMQRLRIVQLYQLVVMIVLKVMMNAAYVVEITLHVLMNAAYQMVQALMLNAGWLSGL